MTQPNVQCHTRQQRDSSAAKQPSWRHCSTAPAQPTSNRTSRGPMPVLRRRRRFGHGRCASGSARRRIDTGPSPSARRIAAGRAASRLPRESLRIRKRDDGRHSSREEASRSHSRDQTLIAELRRLASAIEHPLPVTCIGRRTPATQPWPTLQTPNVSAEGGTEVIRARTHPLGIELSADCRCA